MLIIKATTIRVKSNEMRNRRGINRPRKLSPFSLALSLSPPLNCCTLYAKRDAAVRRVGGSRVCDIASESRASYGTVAASVMRTVESLISSLGRRRERLLGELINLSLANAAYVAPTSSSLVHKEFEWHEEALPTRLTSITYYTGEES